jgi:hypothetical protein
MITSRDAAAQSASQAWSQSLADANHLAVLHAIWDAETTPARRQRYRDLLRSALPAGVEPQESHREQCLHRTLRAAELAGLDAGEVLAHAVASRNLTDIRDIPAAIDARIRKQHGDLTPLPAPACSDQVPEIDPERSRFLTQLAAVIDDRRRRIGEHAAASSLPWAVAALGPPSDDPAARLTWQSKAAAIGAYREISGHDHPYDPIGLEPSPGNPDLRAAWYEARAALAPDEARECGTACHAQGEAGAAQGHGEHDAAVRQADRRQGPGQDSPLPDLAEVSRRAAELAARRRELIAAMAESHSMPVPEQDRGFHFGIGPVLPLDPAHHRAAILHPPKPEIPPSLWIQERLAGRDLDREARE